MSIINTVALMQNRAMASDAAYRLMSNNQTRLNLVSGSNNMNFFGLAQMDKQLSMQNLQDQLLIKMADAFEKNHREKTKKAEGFDTFA